MKINKVYPAIIKDIIKDILKLYKTNDFLDIFKNQKGTEEMTILKLKKFSPVLFGAIMIFFFLPFIDISCNGQKVRSFSGKELTMGTTIYEPENMFGEIVAHKFAPEFFAILAFLCAVSGFFLSFLKSNPNIFRCGLLGWIGAILLILLMNKVKNDALRETGGMIGVSGGIGFSLALLLFLAAGSLYTVFLNWGYRAQETGKKGISENGI